MHIRLQKWVFIGQEKDVTDKHAKSSQWAGGKEMGIRRLEGTQWNCVFKICPCIYRPVEGLGSLFTHRHQEPAYSFYCRAQTRGTETCGNTKYQPGYIFCFLPTLTTGSMILRNHVHAQSHNRRYIFSFTLTLPHSNYPCYMPIHSWKPSQRFLIHNEYRVRPEITRWRKSDNFGQCIAAA